jgi:hypothetical protein
LSTIFVYYFIVDHYSFIFDCFTEKLHSYFIFISGGLVVVISTDFDFTLLYKLIRNLLTAILAPTRGWGNQPLPGHLNETDDIERIRHLRNILAHNSEFEICDTDFFTHWTDLSQVIYCHFMPICRFIIGEIIYNYEITVLYFKLRKIPRNVVDDFGI